ncbi:MAG: sigma 54-interacting transcriptional regulator [Clostridia bacterium]|nr:sigma 54-interacting transcriptional regulator [Clostridia bacterium]
MYDLLDTIIESSYDGIFITDGAGNTLKVNKAYEKLTGIEREKLIGRNMNDLEQEGIVSKSASLIVLKEKRPVTLEQWINHKKKLLVTSNPFWDEAGNIEIVVTNVRDVTDLEILKQEIDKNKEIVSEMQMQIFKDEDMVVKDPKSLFVINMANRIAKKETTAIVTGETGTGKEVLAKYIHKNSLRADEAFISVNCGAIPEHLVESELFGYEKGAFTGANTIGKAGLFEVADQGTLFLDEVGELPLSMQVKLLRVLQEGEVQRVGAVKPKKIDVRVIAATNRDLYQMTLEGTFREDLYYRLNIVPIKMPPLRERQEDIAPLSKLFLDRLNERYGEDKQLSVAVLDAFCHYEWPGNVRQLKNIIERCYVMSEGSKIEIEALPRDIKEVSYTMMGSSGIMDMKEAVARVEMDLIEKAFTQYGNVRDAAKALGIDASTFVRKRKKHHLL